MENEEKYADEQEDSDDREDSDVVLENKRSIQLLRGVVPAPLSQDSSQYPYQDAKVFSGQYDGVDLKMNEKTMRDLGVAAQEWIDYKNSKEGKELRANLEQEHSKADVSF